MIYNSVHRRLLKYHSVWDEKSWERSFSVLSYNRTLRYLFKNLLCYYHLNEGHPFPIAKTDSHRNVEIISTLRNQVWHKNKRKDYSW